MLVVALLVAGAAAARAAGDPRRCAPASEQRMGSDQRAFVAFGSDLQDPFDRRGVFWVAQEAVAVEGADRREAGVASPGGAPAVGLEVLQERADERRVELAEVKL